MNSRRSRRVVKPAQRTPGFSAATPGSSKFPKWLIVMSCAVALIGLNLLLFHRKLMVAFQEMHAPAGSSASMATNRASAADATTNGTASFPSLSVVTESDREKALSHFTRGTE